MSAQKFVDSLHINQPFTPVKAYRHILSLSREHTTAHKIAHAHTSAESRVIFYTLPAVAYLRCNNKHELSQR